MTKLYNKFRAYLLITFLVIVSTVVLWLPFLLKSPQWAGLSIPASNFEYVLKHFDGPLYVVAAKTLYNPDLISALGLETSLPPIYFAAHLPMYPLLILIAAPAFGYLKSMLVVNIVFTVLLAILFYEFLKNLKISKHPLLLTSVFLFLPRFLVVRSVGAPEALFMFLVLASLFAFEKKNYVLAALMGALATATKTPGILLFAVYAAVFVEAYVKEKKVRVDMLWAGLIPLGLVGVFLLYLRQYGDFFAYFHTGGVVPMPYPFSAFNAQALWVGTAWLEDILFYFFMYLLAVFYLAKTKFRSLFYFSVVFFIGVIFVQHRDIARYALPLWITACVAFESFLTSKRFLWVLVLLLPAIYLYGWNFMLHNIMPISNWAPYL